MRRPFFFLALFLLPSLALAQDTAAATAPEEMTLWQLLQSVGWVLAPLVVLSSAVLALIVFNFFWIRNKNIASKHFLSMAEDALRKRDLEALLQDCDDTKEAVARVLGKTVRFAKANPAADLEQLKQIAEAEGSHEAARVNQPNALLMDLGVMAPMVGLLGTAIGILRSFGNLASDTTPMKTMILAGGVSQALVATAIGLTIGLTAMFFYAWFRFRVASVVAYFDRVLTPLLVQTSICLGQGRHKPLTAKEAEAFGPKA